MLAELDRADLDALLAEPSRSGVTPLWQPTDVERDAELRQVRARGWALTDEQLARGVRSVAAPVRDGERVVAAVNVNCHAAETSLEELRDHHLPLLLRAAGDIGADLRLTANHMRHAKLETTMGYMEDGDLFRNNAGKGFL